MALGSPPPTVSWVTEGKAVTDVPGALTVLHNGSLHFLPFRASAYRHDVHAATYRCVAANVVGRVTSRDVRVHAGESDAGRRSCASVARLSFCRAV